MSTTRLSDAIVPEVFFGYMQKRTMQKSAFYGAGVMSDAPEMAEKLAGGGRTFNVPFWKDLDDTESDTASDDPASLSTPGNLTSGKDIARRQVRTRSWSTANLVRELAGDDPMRRIADVAGDYWARQFDDVAIATARGLFADNSDNDAGDMINDIATDGGGAIGAAELFSADAVLDTAQTLGDAKGNVSLLVMHSVVHNRLAKQQLIDYRMDAEGKVWWPYYLDYRLHVSDKCPAVAGANRTTYHTYLMGAGAMGWAESPVAKPVETESTPAAGDGMGFETLFTRRQFACHPYGIKFTDSSVGAEFPTNTELRLATNWDRVYAERKQIPMALLKTNG